MRALHVPAAGAQPELGDLPIPSVTEGTVLVRVKAVGEGVDHVAVGDEVLGHVLFAPPIQAGTLAEYALLPITKQIAKAIKRR